ncbi:MAG TPA: right-handed parallel beta-helix repeat-containing protein [Pyrinomonadaceae bacterium]|nr:right-handed parallel beta-helix repeat-containing protein [Pyrinomonadaceae bacterium]
MSLTRYLFALSGLVLLLIVTPSAKAQATRTWVSGVGDDVNPCSRTAPCKTFAGAISKTAVNGEINCIDPAGYGAVTITKSITIDCTGTFGSILAAGTNGIIIRVADTDIRKSVRIRGLAINGAATGTNGVRIISPSNVVIENTVIDGFIQAGISVEEAATVFVRNTSLRGSGIGINVAGKATVTLSQNLITANATAVVNKGGSIFSYKDNVIEGKTDGTLTPVLLH